MTSCMDSWQTWESMRGLLNLKWTGEVNICFLRKTPRCLPFNTIIRRCFCILKSTLWSLEEAHCGPGEFRTPLPNVGFLSHWIWGAANWKHVPGNRHVNMLVDEKWKRQVKHRRKAEEERYNLALQPQPGSTGVWKKVKTGTAETTFQPHEWEFESENILNMLDALLYVI